MEGKLITLGERRTVCDDKVTEWDAAADKLETVCDSSYVVSVLNFHHMASYWIYIMITRIISCPYRSQDQKEAGARIEAERSCC